MAVISRRSRERCGTRYFARGIDEDANVANFSETEQLLVFNEEGRSIYYSHVQARGSIPVFWAENNDIGFVPKLHLTKPVEKAVRPHPPSLYFLFSLCLSGGDWG